MNKSDAQAIHTQNHLNYQNKPFQITLVRDDTTKPNLILTLNCTDDTRKNVKDAFDTVKTRKDLFDGGVTDTDVRIYFYDGLAIGDYLSYNEMLSVSTQFTARIDPSFYIKGKGKQALNTCQNLSNLDAMVQRFGFAFDILYNLINLSGRNTEQIQHYLDTLSFDEVMPV